MSTINIWRVNTSDRVWEITLPSLQKGEADVSAHDEALTAVARIVSLLDELDNGEAIVITRTIV